MNKNIKKPRYLDMYKAILTLETVDECVKFFDDLCSVTEIKAMEQRYQVAELLNQGLVYNDILEKTGASSATISRVRRSMLDGGAGGVMRNVILRTNLAAEKPAEDDKEE